MGGTTSSPSDWKSYTSTHAPRSAASYKSIYTNTVGVKEAYDPLHIKMRESRNSPACPQATPIIFGIDGTGSMDAVLKAVITNIGDLMGEIYDRRPVTDPHIMAMIFQDVAVGNRKPLQATQFEADVIIVDQLKDLYIEMGGGGNDSESYHLPLYFAATRTVADAFDEGRKGVIFTIGDESVPPPLTRHHIQEVFGPDEPFSEEISYEQILAMVSENYEVYHLMVTETTTGRRLLSPGGRGLEKWRQVLGERAITLTDVNDIAQVVVALLQVQAGADKKSVVDSFSGSTALTVATALNSLTDPSAGSSGVARL